MGAASVQNSGRRPFAANTGAGGHRSSSRWTSLTRVDPAVSTGSVQAYGPRPTDARTPSIRVRSSVKWTALTGVTPGVITGSVKGRGTITLNAWVAAVFEPPTSVAVTVTSAVPSDTGVTVTALPVVVTAATAGVDEVAP